RGKAPWRSEFEVLNFAVEQLEDRVYLAADVSVAKSAPPTGVVGTQVTDTVTITNNSGAALTNVPFSDVLGNYFNVSGVSANDGLGDTFNYSNGTLSGAIANLPTGGTSITIQYTPTVAGLFTDLAAVNILGNTSTSPFAYGTTSVTAPATSVSVAKSAPANSTVGTTITDTVTLTNNGANSVANVPFSDVFGNFNVSGVSASDGLGDTFTYANGTLSGTIDNLPTGNTAITIQYTPTAAGIFTDLAAVNILGNTSTSPFAYGTTSVTAPASSVSVAKSAPANGAVGTQVTDTVTLTNNGANAVANVPFYDVFGNINVSGVSANDGLGDTFTFANGTLSGAIASLPTGNTIITITYTPTAAGVYTDVAAVNIVGNTGTPTYAYGITSVPIATGTNVSVSKTAPSTGAIGTTVTDTVTLTNNGANPVANVPFSDVFGNLNVSGVSASDGLGDTFTYSHGVVSGVIASLPTHSTTITITYTPTAAGIYTDVAAVNMLGNIGTPTSAYGITSVPVAAGTSVSVAKSAPANGLINTLVTDTVTLTNNGVNAVANVSFSDVFGNFNVSADVTASDGLGDTFTYANGTISGVIASLPTGNTTITITFTPTAAGIYADTASVIVAGNTASPVSATGSTTVRNPTSLIAGAGFLAGAPGDGTPQTFVQSLYRELLGREPDATGEAGWLAYLSQPQHDNALGRLSVIQGFLNSQEYAAHWVTTAYATILGRAPSQADLTYWTQQLGHPGTPSLSSNEENIVAAFLGSDEFYAKSGGTVQQWLNAVVLDVLGRSPNDTDPASWSTPGNSAAGRAGVALAILNTPEAHHDLLDAFYPEQGGTADNILGSPGTPAGFGLYALAQLTGAGWENLYLEGPYGDAPEGNDAFFASLAAGATWEDVQLAILSTPQFYNNVNRPHTIA
ncbi:MAG TPA: DUF4214 domain-containing protein, partial [Pirellulales bacterium]